MIHDDAPSDLVKASTSIEPAEPITLEQLLRQRRRALINAMRGRAETTGQIETGWIESLAATHRALQALEADVR